MGECDVMLRTDDPRFKAAIELMDRARYKEALQQLDHLLAVLTAEDRVVALFWRTACLTWLGDIPEARKSVDDALMMVDARNPLSVCLQFQSAFLLRVEEGPAKAVEEIRSLLRRYGEEMKSDDLFWIYVQAKTYLGSSLSLAGDYTEAARELGEALSLETQPLARYYIRFWLGDALYQLGELDRAREQLEGALGEAESAPKEGLSAYYAARLPYELALIDYRQFRFADARRHLELALQAGTEDVDLLRVIERFNVAVNEANRQ